MPNYPNMQGFIIDVDEVHWEEPTMTDAEMEKRKRLAELQRETYVVSADAEMLKYPKYYEKITTPKEYGMKRMGFNKRTQRRKK